MQPDCSAMTPQESLLDISDLKQFNSFRDLNNLALMEILRESEIRLLGSDDTLNAAEEAAHKVFLLRGELMLMAGDKVMETITAGSVRSREPVFRINPEGLKAICWKPAEVLLVEARLLAKYCHPVAAPTSGSPVSYTEIELSEEENELLSEVYHHFRSQRVDLPTCPQIARRVNQLLEPPQPDPQEVVSLLQADPVIAAQIVQMANNPFYRVGEGVQSLRQAIEQIGMAAVKSQVMSAVMRHLYLPQTLLVKQRLRELYAHSIQIAAISHAIARHKRRFDPDRALLAGLLHDIGTIPVLIMADQHLNLSTDARLLESAIRKLHGFVGGMLLQQWGFDQELVIVAEESD
ncbi:MAG TPA: HDOD domain-containing protein, partial [Chromatiales bacterium]|nr:HDOD domain-containing protein [Chromatiales bacterium]